MALLEPLETTIRNYDGNTTYEWSFLPLETTTTVGRTHGDTSMERHPSNRKCPIISLNMVVGQAVKQPMGYDNGELG